jgi:hypothetical protein
MPRLLSKLLIVLSLCWVGSASAALMDPVQVNGTEWLQPVDFVGYSWGDIATVCDPITGACNGSIGGDDLTGWTWASLLDIGDLFHTTMPNIFPGGIHSTFILSNEVNTEVNDFFDVWGFEPTIEFDAGLGPVRSVAGYASDSGATSSPYVQATNYIGENVAIVDNTGAYDSDSPGAWLFRDAPAGIPIPATIPLLGIALAVLGLSRRSTLRG